MASRYLRFLLTSAFVAAFCVATCKAVTTVSVNSTATHSIPSTLCEFATPAFTVTDERAPAFQMGRYLR